MLVNEVKKMKLHLLKKSWLLIIGLILLSSFITVTMSLFNNGGSSFSVINPSMGKPLLEQPNVEQKVVPKHLSEHIVEYHMEVGLNAEDKQLQGTQIVTWKHPGKKAV